MTDPIETPSNGIPPTNRETLFVTAATSPWGAENSLKTIIQFSVPNERISVLHSSTEIGSFLHSNQIDALVCPSSSKGRIGKLLDFYREIVKAHRTKTVVIFSLQLSPLSLLLRLDPRFKGRTVLDVHDVPESRSDMFFARTFARTANRTISISEYVHDALKRPRNGAIIARPIADTRKSTAKDDKAYENIGIVGRVDPEKHVDLAIDAMHYLPERITLKIYGKPFLADSVYEDQLREKASQLGPNRVHFMGVHPIDEICENISVLIVCNPNEPSGRTVGEAMLRGVPAVVPHLGGSKEYLSPDHQDRIYQSLDARSLASKIKEQLESNHSTASLESDADWIIATRNPAKISRDYLITVHDR